MKRYLKHRRIRQGLIFAIGSIVALYGVPLALFQPSHDRDRELGQEALPYIAMDDTGTITITKFRNFDWRKEGAVSPRYESRTFHSRDLNRVDVFISHFDDFEGLADIFLSFGFANSQHLVVSLETRRENDEAFSPSRGIFRQFEIIYVVGSEEDIVGLRTDVREGERVYLYPTKATEKQSRDLFVAIANDINDVHGKPRIYNTLTRNCTNELARRVEDISTVRFPITWKTILPGYFDEVLYRIAIIENEAPFDKVKAAHLVDNQAVDRHQPKYSADLRASIGLDADSP